MEPYRFGAKTIPWDDLYPPKGVDFEPQSGSFGSVIRARHITRAASHDVAIKLFELNSLGKKDVAELIEQLKSLDREVIAQQRACEAVVAAGHHGSNNHIVAIRGVAHGQPPQRWKDWLDAHYTKYAVRNRQAEAGGGSVYYMVGIVMAWQDGGTLADHIYKGEDTYVGATRWCERASTADKVLVLCQLAHALHSLHTFDPCIVHGDLKPANIMLDKAPSAKMDFGVRLGDFGLAKTKKQCASLMTRSSGAQTGQGAGTPVYMAPEMFHGPFFPADPTDRRAGISRRTDVYSFGVIMWEMLTGHHAWNGYTHNMVHAKQQGTPPGRASLLPADLTPEIRLLLDRCLGDDKARPDMSTVLAVLGGAQGKLISEHYDIFLSYAWGGDGSKQKLAMEVCDSLRRDGGFKVWMDVNQMTGRLNECMRKAVENSDFCVILASEEYARSKKCTVEWQHVKDTKDCSQVIAVNVEPGRQPGSRDKEGWCTRYRDLHNFLFLGSTLDDSVLYVDLSKAAQIAMEPARLADATCRRDIKEACAKIIDNLRLRMPKKGLSVSAERSSRHAAMLLTGGGESPTHGGAGAGTGYGKPAAANRGVAMMITRSGAAHGEPAPPRAVAAPVLRFTCPTQCGFVTSSKQTFTQHLYKEMKESKKESVEKYFKLVYKDGRVDAVLQLFAKECLSEAAALFDEEEQELTEDEQRQKDAAEKGRYCCPLPDCDFTTSNPAKLGNHLLDEMLGDWDYESIKAEMKAWAENMSRWYGSSHPHIKVARQQLDDARGRYETEREEEIRAEEERKAQERAARKKQEAERARVASAGAVRCATEERDYRPSRAADSAFRSERGNGITWIYPASQPSDSYKFAMPGGPGTNSGTCQGCAPSGKANPTKQCGNSKGRSGGDFCHLHSGRQEFYNQGCVE